MKIWCFDCFSGMRHNDGWGREVAAAAKARGHQAPLFKRPQEPQGDGYVFARRRQFPPLFDEDGPLESLFWRVGLKGIQDREQWALYENKLGQAAYYGKFMPRTWAIHQQNTALHLLAQLEFPLISKASVGSASHNVRLVKGRAEAEAEIAAVFGPGLRLRNCPGTPVQQGYLLWQEFIPHDVTYRVTAVGRQRHVYKRFCYSDRPMAAPSKVAPTQPVPMSDEIESLLAFSNEFFAYAGTQWCAIDVLKATDGWRLLETSLAWARGNDAAGNAPFYDTQRSLNTQAELLIDEIEAGAFG